MLITINGMLIRMDVNDISLIGRSTQGVRLIRLGDDELAATVAKVEKQKSLLKTKRKSKNIESDDDIIECRHRFLRK